MKMGYFRVGICGMVAVLLITNVCGTEAVVDFESSSENALVYRDGWELQWSEAYGGYGHSQHAQPVGDIDEDGVNEVLLGGYGSEGCHIYSYNPVTETYDEEHFWNYPGGTYNGVPSGVCILDIDDDGELDFVASFEYGSYNGIIAYDWDGTTLTELGYYNGLGYDFAFDVYACDYDHDDVDEVIIANAPEYGTGNYHVTALEWVNDAFVHSASWECPDTGEECPMVWSGDPDDDGITEIIAACSESGSAYILSFDGNNWVQEAEIDVGTNVYAIGVGDLDGDGIDELEIGGYDTDVYIYQYQTGSYVEVWSHNYAGEEGIIEGTAIGDADNDGVNEMLVGTHIVHVISYDSGSGTYIEEAVLSSSTGRLAGTIIGDCDSDGFNEVKATEIYGGASTGSEFIYKYYDETSPVTTCEIAGEMAGSDYIGMVTVFLNATDDHTGVDSTMYQIDSGTWQLYSAPFIYDVVGSHTIKFYSVDIAGNIEETQSYDFTIVSAVKISLSGGFGITATVENIGKSMVPSVNCGIELEGGLVLFGKSTTETISDLGPGESATMRALILGLGSSRVTGSVEIPGEPAHQVEHDVKILLFFVYVKPSGG
jgi:hypothetical protein